MRVRAIIWHKLLLGGCYCPKPSGTRRQKFQKVSRIWKGERRLPWKGQAFGGDWGYLLGQGLGNKHCSLLPLPPSSHLPSSNWSNPAEVMRFKWFSLPDRTQDGDRGTVDLGGLREDTWDTCWVLRNSGTSKRRCGARNWMQAGALIGNPKDEEAACHACTAGAQLRCPEVHWWIQGWRDPSPAHRTREAWPKRHLERSGQAERRIEMRRRLGEKTQGGYGWVGEKLTWYSPQSTGIKRKQQTATSKCKCGSTFGTNCQGVSIHTERQPDPPTQETPPTLEPRHPLFMPLISQHPLPQLQFHKASSRICSLGRLGGIVG